MTKKRNLKSFVITTAMAAVLLFGSVSMCFADTANTPAHINVDATTISFEVTEKISLTGNANSVDLTADKTLDVTNNSAVGVLNIDSVAVSAADGWTNVAMTTDFTKLAADAQQFGLSADGSDLTTAYTGAGTVDPGKTDSTEIAGKTGMVTAELSDVKIADLVVTVSII